ncbi:MAG: hypothetical protein ABI905_09720 [Betaproteobacteria bacterium]
MDNTPHNISKALLDLASVSETVLITTAKGRALLKEPKLELGSRGLLERIDGFRSIEQLLAMSGDIIAVHGVLGKLIASGCVATESGAVVQASPAVEERRPPAPVAKPAAPPPSPARTAAPVVAKAVAPTAAKPAAPISPISPASPVAGAPRPVAKPLPVKPVVAAIAPAAQAAPAITPKPVLAPASAPAPVTRGPIKMPTELDNAKRLLFIEAKAVLGNGAAKLKPRIEACGSIEDIYDLIVKFQDHLAATGKADPKVFLDRLTRGLAEARQLTGNNKLHAAE